MHQARIIADHRHGGREQVHGLLQGRIPCQHHRMLIGAVRQRSDDHIGHGLVFPGTKDPYLPATLDPVLGHRGIVMLWPALGRPEFSPGTQSQHRAVQVQIMRCHGPIARIVTDLQVRGGNLVQPRNRCPFRQRQRHKTLHHQGVAFLVQFAHIVEQPIAHFAAPAGAHRDLRRKRHQRRLERIGQHITLLIVAAQGFPQCVPLTKTQIAMVKRQRQRLTHFRHA